MAACLEDGRGRRVEYLRLSVTDRCDLRCSYCLPKGFKGFLPQDHWLDFDEIVRLVGIFARLGLKRVRLTGGEPLTRNGLPDLARRLAAIPGVEDLSLSTNGTRLASCAGELKDAGISRLNVSLDTLNRRRFAAITGKDALAEVLAGLDAAAGSGFAPIKINMVAMAGVNEDEIDAMVAYCADRGFILRFIEAMPMGASGRGTGFVSLDPIHNRLKARFGLLDGLVAGGGPARYLVSPDGKFSVGFITPLSQHFCATCNRVRLSADGMLHLCLGQEDCVDLRRLLRDGGSDSDVEAAVVAGLRRKPERHEFREQPRKLIRVMASTGG
jgi:cyclic pyranopterin phosphate synthase